MNLDLRIHPEMPRRSDFRIGILGAGSIVLAVNQNMRFDPSVRACKTLLDNLQTMALVDAAYQSAEQGRAVAPDALAPIPGAGARSPPFGVF